MWRTIIPILVVAVLVGGYALWNKGTPSSKETATGEDMTQGTTVDSAVSFYLDGANAEASTTSNDEANAADATTNSNVTSDFGQVYSTNDF